VAKAGVWFQLEGETSPEWKRLESVATAEIRTCGPGTDAVLRWLRALAGEVGPGFGTVWRSEWPG
jgi:hypothetical protein